MLKPLSIPLQLSFTTFLCLSASPILAQVTSDGTVNTQVNLQENVSEITGGEARGSNLFHSFQDFSVPTGNEAFFNNAESIGNIFSRVTGGNISNIDGLIRANGSANLFLINPAGIVLGENARLDIGGSFFGSTADSILFNDGKFSATDLDNPPLLTVNAPIGLNFRDNPGDITVRGDGNGARLSDSELIDTQDALRVGENATIGFLGGNVLFEDATVKTVGGRIEVGSVAEGTVDLVAVDNGFTFGYSQIDTFRDISLSGRSVIDASGLGGGDIQAAGNNISITGVSGFTSFTLGSTPGSDLNIFAAESLDISGVENELNFGSGIFSRTFPGSTADAGNINIETGSLTIGDRALINSSVSGEGNAGNVTINATDSIVLEGNDPNSSTDFAITTDVIGEKAVGNAGNIEITTNSFLNNGRVLFTSNGANGRAGNITIDAAEDVSFSNNSGLSVTGAPGGSIDLSAKNLSITSGSSLFAGTFGETSSPEAQSGDITINLEEDLILDGLESNDSTSITNSSFGKGNLGDINISARNITFKNGGNINAFSNEQEVVRIGDVTLNATGNIVFDGTRSSSRSGILNSILPNSSASIGAINVTAQNLTLTNGAAISSQVIGSGNSGDINIDVANSIKIDGFSDASTDNSSATLPSQISSNIDPNGNGDAGTISINTRNLELSRNGSINADLFGVGNGGDINLNAERITISQQGSTDLVPSSITARTVGNAEGNGGNITIDTGSLFISDGGSIEVDIFGVGDAGNIKIDARDTVSVKGTGILDNTEPSSQISADTINSVGNAGYLEINTANLSVADGAFISADILSDGSVANTGDGGSIIINASDSINVSGRGAIEADIIGPNSTGNAGNLTLSTQRLNVENGAQISATTFSDGDAGSLTIIATESIELDGSTEFSTSGILASALEGNGNGGDLIISTGDLTISNGAIITASNFSSRGQEGDGAAPGTGLPGEIEITADSINLFDRGRIEAVTQSAEGEGANITLQVNEDITLQDGSSISARAFDSGNGGNLTIDSRFIIAFPSDGNGSDIIASAEQGQGGNITINAESLLGIQERPLSNLTNDINASSEVSGLDGTIDITNPEVDPVQGATELPSNVVEAGETTQQVCQANRESSASNTLTIGGKGGLVPEPGLPLDSFNFIVNGDNPISTTPAPIETAQGKIQLARGIKVSESGEIILTAYRTNNAGERLPETTNCDRV